MILSGGEIFGDIPKTTNWTKIEQIHKGWSSDSKYHIITDNGEQLLLRISPITQYEAKEKEYDIVCKYATLGFEMSRPIAFGKCNNDQWVYMLLSWVEGEDLETVLPRLTTTQQYEIGIQAGEILRKIHSIPLAPSDIPSATKIPKKIKQLERYVDCTSRIHGDEIAIAFVKDNIHKIWSKPPVYQHGDFHPGNLIFTPNMGVGVIDFNRWEVGDPYEEFYKLQSFGVEVSIPYCIGEITGYFNGEIPPEFWEVLAVYVAHSSLFSIKWAEQFGEADISGMVERCEKTFIHYDSFHSTIPTWYEE